jgi:hypothetical protein
MTFIKTTDKLVWYCSCGQRCGSYSEFLKHKKMMHFSVSPIPKYERDGIVLELK